jgi:hypothetical protein
MGLTGCEGFKKPGLSYKDYSSHASYRVAFRVCKLALFFNRHRAAHRLVGGRVSAADRYAVGGGADSAGDGLFGRRVIAGETDRCAATTGQNQAGDQDGCDSFFHVFLSFCVRFGAGRLFILLIANTILAQVAKNEKPTVGF